ncbi:hypothetical protein F5I97DRAFT_1614701 [Phlebopus sp. FC_14]|nr:hypothetical protein F5I97DRAFT_1614701 [Phlebopus sp. FC_14]
MCYVMVRVHPLEPLPSIIVFHAKAFAHHVWTPTKGDGSAHQCHLQKPTTSRTKVVIWLYDNIEMRIEGRIIAMA